MLNGVETRHRSEMQTQMENMLPADGGDLKDGGRNHQCVRGGLTRGECFRDGPRSLRCQMAQLYQLTKTDIKKPLTPPCFNLEETRARSLRGSLTNAKTHRDQAPSATRAGSSDSSRSSSTVVMLSSARCLHVCPVVNPARRHASSARGRQTLCCRPSRTISSSCVPRM